MSFNPRNKGSKIRAKLEQNNNNNKFKNRLSLFFLEPKNYVPNTNFRLSLHYSVTEAVLYLFVYMYVTTSIE